MLRARAKIQLQWLTAKHHSLSSAALLTFPTALSTWPADESGGPEPAPQSERGFTEG